jgi:hypothetical protein
MGWLEHLSTGQVAGVERPTLAFTLPGATSQGIDRMNLRRLRYVLTMSGKHFGSFAFNWSRSGRRRLPQGDLNDLASNSLVLSRLCLQSAGSNGRRASITQGGEP